MSIPPEFGTIPGPPEPSTETKQHWRAPRWIAAGILVLLLPKCLLCVAGYLALAAGFAGAAELCGAAAPTPWSRGETAGFIGLLLSLVALGVVAFRARGKRRVMLSGRSRPVR